MRLYERDITPPMHLYVRDVTPPVHLYVRDVTAPTVPGLQVSGEGQGRVLCLRFYPFPGFTSRLCGPPVCLPSGVIS